MVRVDERDEQFATVLAAELLPGEQVLWTGRPDPRWRLRRGDWLVVPCSIVLAAFSIAAVGANLRNLVDPPVRDGVQREVSAGDVVFLLALSIALIGVAGYALVGRFVWQSVDRRRTRYAVTDRRLLDVELNGHRSVGSLPFDRVVGTRTIERHDGSGSMAFGDASRGAPSRSSLVLPAGLLFGAQANGGAAMAFWDVERFGELQQLLRERLVGSGPVRPSR